MGRRGEWERELAYKDIVRLMTAWEEGWTGGSRGECLATSVSRGNEEGRKEEGRRRTNKGQEEGEKCLG